MTRLRHRNRLIHFVFNSEQKRKGLRPSLSSSVYHQRCTVLIAGTVSLKAALLAGPWQTRHCSVFALASVRGPNTVPPLLRICALAILVSWQPEHAALIGESTRVVSAAGVVTPVFALNAKVAP